MNDRFDSKSIDKELQVRLMNLAMGEASDFERDQLQLMMEQRAELAAYYQHLKHLHGLLCEVGSGEPAIECDPSTTGTPWQLPADRREKLLSVLENQKPHSFDKVTLANRAGPSEGLRHWSQWLPLPPLLVCSLG